MRMHKIYVESTLKFKGQLTLRLQDREERPGFVAQGERKRYRCASELAQHREMRLLL